MRFHAALSLLLSFKISDAFVINPVLTSKLAVLPTKQTAATTFLSSSKEQGGWYDDYEDFVQTLDFKDGGWDGGADAPFDKSSSDGSRRFGRNKGGNGRGKAAGRGDFAHDYARDPADTNPADEGLVNDLLSQRTMLRRKGLFDEADNVRDTLLNVHGVTVWDKDRVWTTQPQGGRGGGRRDTRDRFGGRGGGGRGERGGRGGRGRGSGRGRGRERQLNEHGHDYYQTGGPIDPSVCSLPEKEIHMLIRERMECKFDRNFEMADSIERELMSYGVNVHDGFKKWRADGEGWSRDGGSRDRAPREAKVYCQRGPGIGLSQDDIEAITKLVEERSEAKATGEYDKADAIFAKLTDTYNVNVDDRQGEWALRHEEYQMSSDTAIVPDESVQRIIGEKLAERILARKNRDFDLADAIRQELKREYMVEIDDRSKEWKVCHPEGAKWADEDDVEGDDYGYLNIVSKDEFERDEDEDDLEDEDSESDNSEISDHDEGVINEFASDLSSLTIPELKERLRDAGLPVSGKKAELIERLANAP
ncbi:hypothetical protein HJC23_003928 [Cyclotella cryptica]|uniref:SAP domain-containing protein n=1 Tax=Cyclotella cryptica TaxID=29204 RepID=A0ABD3PWD1_9STRA|eukprot:CCRYP_011472-RA/>CCRYP_011472-RA protein AED:0.10 eAED:0.10 QI:316/1/1/1/1/1/2/28/533